MITTESFHRAGGVPAIMGQLLQTGLLNESPITVRNAQLHIYINRRIHNLSESAFLASTALAACLLLLDRRIHNVSESAWLLMRTFHRAGGVPAIMGELATAGLLDESSLTVRKTQTVHIQKGHEHTRTGI